FLNVVNYQLKSMNNLSLSTTQDNKFHTETPTILSVFFLFLIAILYAMNHYTIISELKLNKFCYVKSLLPVCHCIYSMLKKDITSPSARPFNFTFYFTLFIFSKKECYH